MLGVIAIEFLLAKSTPSRPRPSCSPPAVTDVFGASHRMPTSAGDGFMMSYNAGLPLEDMEFMQFHPTGLWKLGILVSEAARGEGGILRNKDGERFHGALRTDGERSCSARHGLSPIIQEIARAVDQGRRWHELRPSRSHASRSKIINEKLPEITGFARTYLGVEPTTEGVPIQPTAHYAMGGIPTDVDGRALLDNNGNIVTGFYARANAPA